MSEIKPSEAPTVDGGEEKDWAAAKAFFDNLKTNKPRPVSSFTQVFVLSLCVSLTNLLVLSTIINLMSV